MLYSALQHISLYITAKTDLVRKASSTCTHLTANIPFPYNVLIFEEEHRLDGQGQELGKTYLSVLEQGHLRHIPNTLLPHYSQSLWRCILCTSYTHACLCAAPQCNGEDTQPRRQVLYMIHAVQSIVNPSSVYLDAGYRLTWSIIFL